jgi:hypothetical protein
MSVLGPVRSTGKGLSRKLEDDPGGSWRGTIRQRVKYRAKWLSDPDADPASLPRTPQKARESWIPIPSRAGTAWMDTDWLNAGWRKASVAKTAMKLPKAAPASTSAG